MKKKYIYQIAGVFALSGWLTACQNESELPVPETDNAKVCTLTCTMEAGAQSRASVGYGDEDDQTVKWNLGDQILVFQETANPSETEWDPMWFTNTDAEGSTANFKYTMKNDSDLGLVSGRRLCAIYPVFPIGEDEGGSEESGQPVAARELNTSDYAVVVSLDIEDGFATLMDNSEVSVKDYQRNHIVMTAAGTVGEESTSLEFKHHTAMFHVVYTNASGSTQQIKSIRLKPTLLVEEGDQLLVNCYFGTEAEVDCLTGEQETTEFVYQLGLQFTNPVSVENGATAHFYLVSFPGGAAVANDAIDIEVETTEGTVSLGTTLAVAEIADAVENKQENASLFEAGMRYRFKVTQAGGELRWSKDPIIIDNLPLLRCIDNCLSEGNKLVWESDGKTVDVLKNSAKLGSVQRLYLTDEPDLASLEGLEYLQNVTELSISGAPNLVGTLTEEPFKALGRLVSLYIGNCGYTKLNINGLTSLSQIWCQRSNIGTVEVKETPNLMRFVSSNSPMTYIDLSTSMALEYFQCYHGLSDDSQPKLQTLLLPEQSDALTYFETPREQLTAFEPYRYPNLYWLNLNYNPLNTLNVSQNTKLKYLSVKSCQLATLDVTNCPELTGLYVSNNLLEALDISNNKKLSGLEVNGNQLTVLDASANTELEYLDASNCRLEKLDVTNCRKLTNLYVSYNQLEALDVSNNSKLNSLNVVGNKIAFLDITNTLSSDSGWWWLDCGNQQDGITLMLAIRDDQQSIWDQQKYSSSNRNVELFGKGTGGTGPNFGNGGNL